MKVNQLAILFAVTLFVAPGSALAQVYDAAPRLDSRPPTKAAAQRYLSDARLELSRGRNSLAEVSLRKAIMADPYDSNSHYLLANIYAKTGRHIDAQAEYAAALEVDQGTTIGEYCRQALRLYGRASGRGLTTSAPSAARMTPVSGITAYSPPSTDLSHVDAALDKINRDAEFEKARKRKYATNLAKTAIKGGDWKASELKEVAETEIAAVHSTVSHRDKSAAEYLRRKADERARLERAMAKERHDAHHEWARDKQRELDEVAGNLKEQLQGRSSPYGVDLVPTGTNLYVRNYKVSGSKKKLAEPRFSVLRFVDRGMVDDSTQPEPPEP